MKDSLVFGVDVGGTSIKIGVFNLEGELLLNDEITTNVLENTIIKDIADFIINYIYDNKKTIIDITGIGLGLPGPVNDFGEVQKCVNLNWGVFNIEEEFKNIFINEYFEKFNKKVDRNEVFIKATNDANCAGLGENWKGSAKNFKNSVFITLGTGLGGAIIINEKIVNGNNGAAGEIGHIVVDYDEKELCSCGKTGCLEQKVSATGIVKIAKKLFEDNNKENNKDNNTENKLNNDLSAKKESLTAKDIFDAAKTGNEFANEVIEIYSKYLGIGLSHVATLVNPEAFIFGGGMSKAGELVYNRAIKYFDKYVFLPCKNVSFNLAELGNKAGMYGAAFYVLSCKDKK